MAGNRNTRPRLGGDTLSLLDIIANLLGVVLFIAFFFLLAPHSVDVHTTRRLQQRKAKQGIAPPPMMVDIPWSRLQGERHYVIILAANNRLVHVDFNRVCAQLSPQVDDRLPREAVIDGKYRISFLPVADGDAHNVWFTVKPMTVDLDPQQEALADLLRDLPAKQTRLAFFVYPSGHEVFYRSYHLYRKKGYSISWFMVPDENEPYYIGHSYEGEKVMAE